MTALATSATAMPEFMMRADFGACIKLDNSTPRYSQPACMKPISTQRMPAFATASANGRSGNKATPATTAAMAKYALGFPIPRSTPPRKEGVLVSALAAANGGAVAICSARYRMYRAPRTRMANAAAGNAETMDTKPARTSSRTSIVPSANPVTYGAARRAPNAAPTAAALKLDGPGLPMMTSAVDINTVVLQSRSRVPMVRANLVECAI